MHAIRPCTDDPRTQVGTWYTDSTRHAHQSQRGALSALHSAVDGTRWPWLAATRGGWLALKLQQCSSAAAVARRRSAQYNCGAKRAQRASLAKDTFVLVINKDRFIDTAVRRRSAAARRDAASDTVCSLSFPTNRWAPRSTSPRQCHTAHRNASLAPTNALLAESQTIEQPAEPWNQTVYWTLRFRSRGPHKPAQATAGRRIGQGAVARLVRAGPGPARVHVSSLEPDR